MAKSKSARRRARMAGGASIPYARMRPNLANWIVGGSATDNTGSVIGGASPTGPSTWSCTPANAQTIVPSTPFSYQAVTIVAAPNTTTPTIGRIKVDEVKGHIYVCDFTNASEHAFAVGIYVSEFNSNSGKWDVRDPMITSDAARDDYFFLEAQAWDFPITTNATAQSGFRFDLKLSNPLILGGGQALHVTVSYRNAANTGSATCYSMFRSRVGPVA